MMPSKKKIKKILIILALLLVNAWFWGNAVLEYYTYRILAPEDYILAELNRVPEKLKIPASDIEDEYLYFFNYGVKMPFLKGKSMDLLPLFLNRRLYLVTMIVNNGECREITINLNQSPMGLDIFEEESIFWRTFNRLIFRNKDDQELSEKIYYSKLSDLSWWNLLWNVRLNAYLTIKSITRRSGPYQTYDVKTPYVSGFLVDASYDTFDFTLNERSFYISSFPVENSTYDIRDIIATITPIKNIDKAYKEVEGLYNNNPGYPEELLILSMISLKGPQENYQREYVINELRDWLERYKKDYESEENEEDKEWDRKQIEEITSDIAFFEKSME